MTTYHPGRDLDRARVHNRLRLREHVLDHACASMPLTAVCIKIDSLYMDLPKDVLKIVGLFLFLTAFMVTGLAAYQRPFMGILLYNTT